MSNTTIRARALCLSLVAAGAVACSSAIPGSGTGVDDSTSGPPRGMDDGTKSGGGKADGGGGSSGTSGGPSGGAPDKCPYDGPPVDVSAFPKCLDGGRCVPEGIIPADEKARLSKCDTGYCVPEKIIKAHGVLLPKSCKSVAGGEGRCISTVFPDMAAQKDTLPVDACDANERCAPCFDPVSGKDTAACRSVTCDAPKEPAKVFGSCCQTDGKPEGRCIPKSMVPTAQQSGLDQKECTQAELCTPQETLAQGWKPPKCTASALLGSYDGVCISNCVHQDFLTGLGTAQGTCDADHFCAPCANPLTGASTGAPGCAP